MEVVLITLGAIFLVLFAIAFYLALGGLRPQKIYTEADLPPAFWRAAREERDKSRRAIADNITPAGWAQLANCEPSTSGHAVYCELRRYRSAA